MSCNLLVLFVLLHYEYMLLGEKRLHDFSLFYFFSLPLLSRYYLKNKTHIEMLKMQELETVFFWIHKTADIFKILYTL